MAQFNHTCDRRCFGDEMETATVEAEIVEVTGIEQFLAVEAELRSRGRRITRLKCIDTASWEIEAWPERPVKAVPRQRTLFDF